VFLDVVSLDLLDQLFGEGLIDRYGAGRDRLSGYQDECPGHSGSAKCTVTTVRTHDGIPH
jgi:hypothetical protein